MIKNFTSIIYRIEEREYRLSCDMDSPTQHVLAFLNQCIADIKEMEKRALSKQEENKPKEEMPQEIT